MVNFDEALVHAYTATLRDSNGKINQTDRNNLRKQLLDALIRDISGVMTSDGIIHEVEHEYWGSVFVELSIKIKDVDYDLNTAVDEYQEKLSKAETRRMEAERRSRERAEKSAAIRASKNLE